MKDCKFNNKKDIIYYRKYQDILTKADKHDSSPLDKAFYIGDSDMVDLLEEKLTECDEFINKQKKMITDNNFPSKLGFFNKNQNNNDHDEDFTNNNECQIVYSGRGNK